MVLHVAAAAQDTTRAALPRQPEPARPEWTYRVQPMEGALPDGSAYIRLYTQRIPENELRIVQEEFVYGARVRAESLRITSQVLVYLAEEAGERLHKEPRLMGGVDTTGAFVFSFRQSVRTLLPVVAGGLLLVGLLGGLVWQNRRLRQAREQMAYTRTIRSLADQSREAERKRLARELHDGPLQSIAVVRTHLVLDPDDLERHDDALGEVARELRGLTEELRSPVLDDHGFEDAFRGFASLRYATVRFDLTLHQGDHVLRDPLASALLRVGQEAMGNAVRHGGASAVEVHVHSPRQGASGWTMTIQDNGRGFDRPLNGLPDLLALAEEQHFGLLGMYERVSNLGGTLHIASKPGQGTTLTVALPEAGTL